MNEDTIDLLILLPTPAKGCAMSMCNYPTPSVCGAEDHTLGLMLSCMPVAWRRLPATERTLGNSADNTEGHKKRGGEKFSKTPIFLLQG